MERSGDLGLISELLVNPPFPDSQQIDDLHFLALERGMGRPEHLEKKIADGSRPLRLLLGLGFSSPRTHQANARSDNSDDQQHDRRDHAADQGAMPAGEL